MRYKFNAQFILKLLIIYVILQPLFDILSFLSLRDIIPISISTYVKPLFMFSIAIYVFFAFCKKKTPWIVFFSLYGISVLIHLLLLKNIWVENSIIIHEFRFMINIAYMMVAFFSFYTLLKVIDIDKKQLLDIIKKTLFYTMLFYCIIILIAVITGTSALTYEYSDPNKLGYKGWLDSGQIFGHAFAVTFPINLYIILSPKNHWYKKILILSIFLIVVSLLGTKAPYYIVLAILILDLIISIFIVFLNKKHKVNISNVIILFIAIIIMLFTYKYTPVAYNTNINNQNSKRGMSTYNIDLINGSSNNIDLKLLKKGTEIYKYNVWNIKTSEYLSDLFKSGSLHPSNTRKIQYTYFLYKYKLSDFKYKVFGLGYLNHNSNFSIESDFFMSLFCFGIMGFCLIILLPFTKFLATSVFILKNLKRIDLEMYLVYIGIGVFFSISILAGYTYIYTNFSIFLVLLFLILKIKELQIEDEKSNSIKVNQNKITFLLLHLGYGGIESATINTVNVLSKDYEIEILTFYKLMNNQEKNINSNVKIKYLYDGSPNRKEILGSIKKLNILKFIKQVFISIDIFIKKISLIKKEIVNTDSKYIISTRIEFSVLLSRYGRKNTIKIAQEHQHNNGNKKYISKIRNQYDNIDYLLALTQSLKKEYEEILNKNKHTKIILLPNMISNIPIEKSDLKSNNFITVSRLVKGKCIDEMITNFSKLNNNSKLYIIGDGEETDYLKNKINELKLNDKVIMLGYLNHGLQKQYFLDSCCFLMTSITEALPMVLLEAMGYGLPCIAYETFSGTNDIIKDNYNGFVIKNRNSEEYVEKMLYILKNKNETTKLGKNAIIKTKEFSSTEILKKWKELLNKQF